MQSAVVITLLIPVRRVNQNLNFYTVMAIEMYYIIYIITNFYGYGILRFNFKFLHQCLRGFHAPLFQKKILMPKSF